MLGFKKRLEAYASAQHQKLYGIGSHPRTPLKIFELAAVLHAVIACLPGSLKPSPLLGLSCSRFMPLMIGAVFSNGRNDLVGKSGPPAHIYRIPRSR